MPPSIQQSNAKHYKSNTVTEVKEFEGPHLLPAWPGWEAGRRLRARVGRAPRRHEPSRGVRLTHIGGPTVLIEVGRLAPADRPDVRSPRPAATASAGGRARASWRARRSRPADLGPIDAVLLTPRPPRRQPRPRRPRAAAVRRHGRDDRVGRGAARRRRARPRAVADHGAVGARQDRRSRSWRRRAGTGRRGSRPIVGDVIGFAPALGRPGARRRCGSPATPCSTTACARSRSGCRSARALLHLGGVRFPVTGPLRYTMTAARGGRALRPRAAAHRDPDPLRGLEALPRGPRRGRARVRGRAGRGPRPRPLAADRRGCHTRRMTNERGTAPAR